MYQILLVFPGKLYYDKCKLQGLFETSFFSFKQKLLFYVQIVSIFLQTIRQ